MKAAAAATATTRQRDNLNAPQYRRMNIVCDTLLLDGESQLHDTIRWHDFQRLNPMVFYRKLEVRALQIMCESWGVLRQISRISQTYQLIFWIRARTLENQCIHPESLTLNHALNATFKKILLLLYILY
jgi:hypothetical protein